MSMRALSAFIREPQRDGDRCTVTSSITIPPYVIRESATSSRMRECGVITALAPEASALLLSRVAIHVSWERSAPRSVLS